MAQIGKVDFNDFVGGSGKVSEDFRYCQNFFVLDNSYG